MGPMELLRQLSAITENPARFINETMAGLGISPDTIMAEMQGFKAGLHATTTHFSAQLVEIRQSQARIEMLLTTVLERQGVTVERASQPTIGVLTHER